MKKDIIFTTLTQIFSLLSLLLTFKLVSLYFGVESFAEYSIARRSIAFVIVFIGLGIHIALIRYISVYSSSIVKKINFLFSSLLIFSIVVFIFGLFFYIFRKELSFLIFADFFHSSLILTMYVGIVGLLLHNLVYAYFRGNLSMKYANIIDLINHALFPLIGLYLSQNIISIFWITGTFQALFSIFIIIYILYTNRKFIKYKYILFLGKKLIYYGVVRVPAEVGILAAFTLFVIFINHKFGLLTGGYISFSITIITTLSYAFSPIAIILLPKLTKMNAEKSFKEIFKIIKTVNIFVSIGSIVFIFIFWIFEETLLLFFIPELELYDMNIISYMVFGAVLYPFYTISKSIIDALYVKGINSINFIYCLVGIFPLYLLLSLIINNNIYLYVSLLSIFLSSLAILSFISIYKSVENKNG